MSKVSEGEIMKKGENRGASGRALIAGIFMFLAFILIPQPANAHVSGLDLSGSGTPTIDGVMSAGEWDGAESVLFPVNIPGGGTVTGTLSVMNDAANLYIAVRFNYTDVVNTAYLNFDNDHDGTWEAGEDQLRINPSIGFKDAVHPGVVDTGVGGTNDGAGAFSNSGGVTVYEFSHPLDSTDDANDFSIGAGDTVGFNIFVRLIASGGSWPDDYGDTYFPTPWSYGDITISGEAFISMDSSFGTDTITLDSNTGLQWLDVTLSTPYSYDEILVELLGGGTFEGYRLATSDEVKALWQNAGINTDPGYWGSFTSENFTPIVDFMDYVGVTGDNVGNLGGGNLFDFTAGHIESGPGGGGSVSVATLSADPDPTVTGRPGIGTVSSDNSNSHHGSWLIDTASGTPMVTLDFEGLPDAHYFYGGNTNIGSYYDGVTFGPYVVIFDTVIYGYNWSDGYPPHSGNAVIMPQTLTTRADFDSPTSYVSLWYTSYQEFYLEAYDSDDVLLGSVTGPANVGSNNFLEISASGIAYVTIHTLLQDGAFMYTIDDFTFEVASGPAANIPPEAVDDFYDVIEPDGSLSVLDVDGVLVHGDADYDDDGGPNALTAVKMSDPVNGGVLSSFNADGSFDYAAPDSDMDEAVDVSTDSFTYKAYDGSDFSDPATVTLDFSGIAVDNCPGFFNPDQKDSDVDSTGAPDPDGVGDACDNCTYVYNPGQEDGGINDPGGPDGLGDACDDGIYELAPVEETDPSVKKTWGKPFWLKAKFISQSPPLKTIRPDCFNTTFTVRNPDDTIANPRFRIPPPTICPDDIVTIESGEIFEVTCDLNEMYHIDNLGCKPGDESGDCTVTATYANGVECPDVQLFSDSIESDDTVSFSLDNTFEIVDGEPVYEVATPKEAYCSFNPSEWEAAWSRDGGPDITLSIWDVDDHAVGDIIVSTITINGSGDALDMDDNPSTPPVYAIDEVTGVLSVQLDAKKAIESLGTAVGDTVVYAGIQGDAVANGVTDVFVTTCGVIINGEACGLGYWKNHVDPKGHFKSATAWADAGYGPDESFAVVFGLTEAARALLPVFPDADGDGNPDDMTLLDALKAKGDGATALLAKHGVAGLLSAGHPGIFYPIEEGALIGMVGGAFNTDALNSSEVERLAVAATLEEYDALSCPLGSGR